jgi:phenylalanyl-tRNA synthetase beta subunit
MKHKLKPPGTKRFRLEYEKLLSNFGFNFNLRCYTLVEAVTLIDEFENPKKGLTSNCFRIVYRQGA